MVFFDVGGYAEATVEVVSGAHGRSWLWCFRVSSFPDALVLRISLGWDFGWLGSGWYGLAGDLSRYLARHLRPQSCWLVALGSFGHAIGALGELVGGSTVVISVEERDIGDEEGVLDVV